MATSQSSTGWRTVALRDINAYHSRTVDPRRSPNESFEYYSIPAFQECGHPAVEQGENIGSSKVLVGEGAVLFGKLNPRVLKVWMTETGSRLRKIASTEFIPIVPTAEADAGFIFYLCHSDGVVVEARKRVSGSTPSRQRVQPSRFLDITVPLPPLPEQRAIARALRSIQQARETRRQELELERERKAALMEHLFTHGTRNEPTKQTEIGEMPESWELLPMSVLVAVRSGQVNPSETPYAQMLHVGSENIEQGTGRLTNLRTNEELGISSGNYFFDEDDILYSKIRPYLNKVALPNCSGTCSADIYPLCPKTGIVDRRFLHQVLLSEAFLGQAMKSQDRTGIPKINRNQLAAIVVGKPRLEEQLEIADVLARCDSKMETLQHEMSLLDELFM